MACGRARSLLLRDREEPLRRSELSAPGPRAPSAIARDLPLARRRTGSGESTPISSSRSARRVHRRRRWHSDRSLLPRSAAARARPYGPRAGAQNSPHSVHRDDGGRPGSAKAKELVYDLVATESVVRGEIRDHSRQGSYPECRVIRDRQVMHRLRPVREPDMAARLAHLLVPKGPKEPCELSARQVSRQSHTARRSSRTKWRRTNLGRAASSKWQRTASRTFSWRPSSVSASVNIEAPSARAVYPPSGASSATNTISVGMPPLSPDQTTMSPCPPAPPTAAPWLRYRYGESSAALRSSYSTNPPRGDQRWNYTVHPGPLTALTVLLPECYGLRHRVLSVQHGPNISA
jgi:hypothetical protein